MTPKTDGPLPQDRRPTPPTPNTTNTTNTTTVKSTQPLAERPSAQVADPLTLARLPLTHETKPSVARRSGSVVDVEADAIGSSAEIAIEECVAFIERVRRRVCNETEGHDRSSDEGISESRAGESADLQDDHGAAAQIHRIGRFEIIRELGRGGSGIVFLAHDPELNRRVAIKVPHPECMFSPDWQRRFSREAQLGAALCHPAIVPVYEAGFDGPVRYISSEYCRGVSLAEWIAAQSAPVPEATTAAWVAQLADAIQHAHDHDVLHRDLKPGNILLTIDFPGEAAADSLDDTHASLIALASQWETLRDAATLQPKVTDFGLAKFMGSDGTTTAGAVMGTPAYMAPEQAEGRHSDVDRRTDVYGLGAILYELLTSQAPFRCESDMATLYAVRESDPILPSRLRKGVSQDLEAICLKCLERDRNLRYPTAGALHADLKRFLANQSVFARRPALVARIRKWSQRHPATIASIMATMLIASIVLTISLVAISRANRELSASLVREAGATFAARDAERRSAELLYAADVRLADEALDKGHIAEARERLARHFPLEDQIDRRGFDWQYLWSQVHQEQLTLRAHGPAFDVEYSPDGGLLAASYESGAVALYQSATGEQIRTLDGFAERVRKVDFSPDGKFLAAAGDGGQVRVWRIADGFMAAKFSAHEAELGDIAFHPDGRRLATVGDREVKLYDLTHLLGSDRRQEAGTSDVDRLDGTRPPPTIGIALDKPPGIALCVDIAPDGKQLAVGGDYYVNQEVDTHGYVWTYDLATGRPLREQLCSFKVTAIAYDHGGDRLAAGTQSGELVLFDAELRERIAGARGHSFNVYDLAFTQDDRRLVSVGKDATAKIWDVESLTTQRILYGHGKRVYGTSICAATGQIATASLEGTVKVWHPANALFSTQPLFADATPTARLSHDGQCVVTVGHHGAVDHHVPSSGLHTRSILLDPGKHSLSLQYDGPRLVVYGDRTVVDANDRKTKLASSAALVCDGATLAVEQEIAAVAGAIEIATLSPDGKRLAVGESDHCVRIWDLEARQVRHTIHVEAVRVSDLTYSPDGKFLLAACGDNLAIWDGRDGRLLHFLREHDNTIQRIAVSPNSQTAATVSNDLTVRLWSLNSGRLDRVLVGHKHVPQAVAFSHDGRRLATGTVEGTVRVWDVATGQALLRLLDTAGIVTERINAIQDLAFRGEGALVAVVRDEPHERTFLAEWQNVAP